MKGATQVILLIDALGWELAERTGFLADLLPFRRRLRTILGYSSAAIPSVLTGQPPVGHGRWFLYFKAQGPGQSPFKMAAAMSWLPPSIANRWAVRRRLSDWWRSTGSIDGYFGLYEVPYSELKDLDYVERKDSWKPGTFAHGSYVDDLLKRNIPAFISDWRMTDDEKLRLAIRSASEDDRRVYLLYLTEIDARQHAHGSMGGPVDERLKTYRESIDALLAILRRRGPVSLTVCSDHGMTDIHTVQDPGPVLGELGLLEGRDYRVFIDSTFLRFWPASVSAATRIREACSRIAWGRVLESREIEREGVLFPDDRYGSVFVLANPGVLICPSYMGRTPLKGMHGYTPDDSASDAVLLRGVDDAGPPHSILDLRGLFVSELEGLVG